MRRAYPTSCAGVFPPRRGFQGTVHGPALAAVIAGSLPYGVLSDRELLRAEGDPKKRARFYRRYRSRSLDLSHPWDWWRRQDHIPPLVDLAPPRHLPSPRALPLARLRLSRRL